MTIGDDVLAAADRNMIEAWHRTLAGSPTPGHVEDEHLVLLSSGVRVAAFNRAFVTGPPGDAGAAVVRVVDHYASLGLPFALYFRDEVAGRLAEACAGAGLVEHWRPPLMVLDPIPPSVAGSPPDLRVSRVTAATLDAFCAVLSSGFGMPRELAARVLGQSVLKVEGLTGFIGTVHDEPVGTAAVYLSDGVAGVYNVATVPDSRGKGIGTAMTWAAVRAGCESGARCSILQASEQGEPVYGRMGFATPARYRQFVPPAARG